jgi:CRP-like cAMP-binding protein
LKIREKLISPGEILFKTGEVDRKLYLIRQGTVRYMIQYPQKSVIINKFKGGDIFGTTSFLTGFPRLVTA